MARFGDLEAAIMDVMWAAGEPLRVREVADELNRDRPLAFNTVQTVMENLFRKGWLPASRRRRAANSALAVIAVPLMAFSAPALAAVAISHCRPTPAAQSHHLLTSAQQPVPGPGQTTRG